MQQGSELENFVPNILQLLTAKEQSIRNNGLKVLDMLAKYRGNYSNEFKEEVVKKILQIDLPEAIKSSVEEKLINIQQ